ncbi:carbohydrate ABC transporter permease [Gracilibacillus alcaliphilus]|uniref:carbohydrate ABC transporter permease n=1 Tax=Gracilibacillus alcaliphilus TaxID=1401441 RepID=UPI00195701EA|nr:sugar ABC transporter permease [Gracilibacillus alcaliphilus]MBM7676768.1 multiple sugar transport system permease protein [Gracilibacillus alcaliphilus]
MEVVSTAKRSAKKKHISTIRRREVMWCYIFLFPQLVIYLAFTLWPIIASYYFGFFNWNGTGWPTHFIGFQNFVEVLQDSYFWGAFKNSFIYTIGLVVIVVPTSLIVAIILNSPKLKFATFFRSMFFLPVVLTMAIVGIIMKNIFAFEGGFLNEVLLNIGVIQEPINWLGNTAFAMVALILVGVWKGFGIKVIYWLAGLQTLPKDLYEAARVDGAGIVQQFIYITLPLLIPFLVVITFFQTVWAFNVFDLVKTFTNGGPYFGTDVVPLYIYRYAFEIEGGFPRMGFASAAGIIYGFATMIISIILGILVRKFGSTKTT